MPEPDLEPFDQGIAVLRRAGSIRGYVASETGTFRTLARPLTRQDWVWLSVVWVDGVREPPLEDYPPWTVVLELDAGFLDWDVGGDRAGRYSAEWLPPREREEVRARLRLP